MNYGATFAQIRKSRHFSQKDVADGLLSQSMLSRFENQDGQIEFSVLLALLDKLHVHPTEFIVLAKNQVFLEEHNFTQRLHAAYYNTTDNQILLEEERQKYYETNDIHHLINAVRIETTFSKKNGIAYSHLHTDIVEIKKYLISLDSWFVSEIILYIDLLFLFDSVFIKAQHSRMMRSLSSLPFGTARRNYLQSAYCHNTTVLSFERNTLEDVALYLSSFERTLTKDPRSLTNSIYYSAYEKLLTLKKLFNDTAFQNLMEDIHVLKQYGYDDEYIEIKKFIIKILNCDTSQI